MCDDLEVRPAGADCPEDGINLSSIAASEESHFQRGTNGPLIRQTADQFQLGAVPKKVGTEILAPCDARPNQTMEEIPVCP